MSAVSSFEIITFVTPCLTNRGSEKLSLAHSHSACSRKLHYHLAHPRPWRKGLTLPPCSPIIPCQSGSGQKRIMSCAVSFLVLVYIKTIADFGIGCLHRSWDRFNSILQRTFTSSMHWVWSSQVGASVGEAISWMSGLFFSPPPPP